MRDSRVGSGNREAISFERLQQRNLNGVDPGRPQNFKRQKAKLPVCPKV